MVSDTFVNFALEIFALSVLLQNARFKIFLKPFGIRQRQVGENLFPLDVIPRRSNVIIPRDYSFHRIAHQININRFRQMESIKRAEFVQHSHISVKDRKRNCFLVFAKLTGFKELFLIESHELYYMHGLRLIFTLISSVIYIYISKKIKTLMLKLNYIYICRQLTRRSW